MTVQTTCDKQALSMLFDQELTGDAKRHAEQHLAACHACQATWRFYVWLGFYCNRRRRPKGWRLH